VHDIAIVLVYVLFFFHCPDADTRLVFIVFTAISAVIGRRWLDSESYKAVRGARLFEEYSMQRQKKLKGLEYCISSLFVVHSSYFSNFHIFAPPFWLGTWCLRGGPKSNGIVCTTDFSIFFYLATILLSGLDSPFRVPGSRLVEIIHKMFLRAVQF
jgi:hypothetical protein